MMNSSSASTTSLASLHLQQPRATMEDLPYDVLSNIFIRLFAKQLAQMRSVCKSWNALLCQPSFIKSHLHHSIHNKDDVLLFFHPTPDPLCEPFSAHPSKSPNSKLTNFIISAVNIRGVIGSVNGLICCCYFSDNDMVLQIWNPSLSAVLALPPHGDLPSPTDNYPPMMIISFNLRFGFDPKADDYKVVKLASLGEKLFVVKEWVEVEIYSMRKGSWKPITHRPPSHITGISPQNDVYVDGHDGVLHWLGFIGEDNKGQTVLGFDLGAETFHEIPLPDLLLHSNRTNVLGVLARKLCVMSCVEDGECEVWVMDEYGMVESWVKHHAFSQFRNIRPFGFTLLNEFIFQVEKNDDGYADHRFGLYDPVAAKTKFFKVSKGIITRIVGYVDSLVWVAPNELKYLGSDLHHHLFPLLSIAGIALATTFSVARRWRK